MAYSDFTHDRPGARSTAGTPSPQSCPSCASASLVSTTKVPNGDSYWRCLTCGEVWSPARRMANRTDRWRR